MPHKARCLQLGFLTVLGAVSKTREIKIHDHEESGQVSLGHKQKRNHAGDMSVPSVKSACGCQAAPNHVLDSENSPRCGPGQGRVTDNLVSPPEFRLEMLRCWQVSKSLTFAK